MDILNDHPAQIIVIVQNVNQLQFSLLELLSDLCPHVTQTPAQTDMEGWRIVERWKIEFFQTLVNAVGDLLQVLHTNGGLQSDKCSGSVVIGVDLQLVEGEMERPLLLQLGLDTLYEGLYPVVSEAYHATQAQMVVLDWLQVQLLQDKVFGVV